MYRSGFFLAIFLLFFFATPVVSVSAADLIITDIETAGLVMNCQSLQVFDEVYVKIRNDGVLDCTDDFVVTVFEDTDGSEDFDELLDRILGETTVTGGLAAGAENYETISVSGSLLFAYNRIFAEVDSADSVSETDETNNLWNTGLQCEYIPPPAIFSPEIEWKWSGSPDMPTHIQVMSAPVVANLTDDNMDSKIDENDIPDVVFNCYSGGAYRHDGVLRAIQGLGGTPVFTVTDSSLRTSPGFNIGVGDIDGDMLPEILAAKSSGSSSAPPTMLLAFEHDGTCKWTSDVISISNVASATIADLDGDSSPEIIVGENVLNSDGSVRWTGSLGNTGLGISCVADLDMSGFPEVIAGSAAYRSDGTIYWNIPAIASAYAAVGDFDSDPFPEVVLVGGGYVYLVEHDGVIIWGPLDIPPVGTYRDHGGPPTIADFDGDTFNEIGVAAGDNYCVIDTGGTVLWAQPTSDHSSNRTGSSVFDFDGDGDAEAVYSDEYNLYIYNGIDGTVLFSAPSPSGTLLELPLIVDVDNDNNAEIIMACNNYAFPGDTGIQCWGDKFDNWINCRNIWNQHAYHITNIEDDSRIPAIETNNWELYNNYRCQKPLESKFLAPDLTSSWIRLDEDDCPDFAGLIARIGNGGGLCANAPVLVSFYDGIPLPTNLIGTVSTSIDLNPGDYEDVSVIWTGFGADVHDIHVVADDDGTGTGTVNECDETNNECNYETPICYCCWNLPGINLGPTINTLYRELHPFITPDGMTLFFASNRTDRGARGRMDLWVSHKTGFGDINWSVPVNLGPNVNSTWWDASPALTRDLQRLYFESFTETYRSIDLYYSNWKSGSWGPRKLIRSPVSTSSFDEKHPFPHPDNVTLYFDSTNTAGIGGSNDIWKTVYNPVRKSWSIPVQLNTNINTGAYEAAPIISHEGKTLIFESTRGGDNELWVSDWDSVLDDWGPAYKLCGDWPGGTLRPMMTNAFDKIYFYTNGKYGMEDLIVSNCIGVESLHPVPFLNSVLIVLLFIALTLVLFQVRS